MNPENTPNLLNIFRSAELLFNEHQRNQQAEFEKTLVAIQLLIVKEVNTQEPITKEDAKCKIENFTIESFKLYLENNCLTNDKVQFIQNELEHNQVRLDIAKEKGWGFSTQVREHCIKIINEYLLSQTT